MTELVPLLARVIEESSLPRSPVQEHAILQLQAMLVYANRRRIDLWEDAFPWESTQDGSALALLLEAVYELGRLNLYTRFNPRGTLQEYKMVKVKFAESGLMTPAVDEIADW